MNPRRKSKMSFPWQLVVDRKQCGKISSKGISAQSIIPKVFLSLVVKTCSTTQEVLPKQLEEFMLL